MQSSFGTVHYKTSEDVPIWPKEVSKVFTGEGQRKIPHKEERVRVTVAGRELVVVQDSAIEESQSIAGSIVVGKNYSNCKLIHAHCE